MRIFAYNEQGQDHPVLITDDDILTDYYPYWSGEMLKRGKSPLITTENCIEDFVVVNWAWRVKDVANE